MGKLPYIGRKAEKCGRAEMEAKNSARLVQVQFLETWIMKYQSKQVRKLRSLV